MSDRLIFVCAYGKDDPERAILAFTAANIAAMAGQSTAILCTIEGVWLGTPGGTDGVEREGFKPLTDLYAEYIENGGEVWLCGLCTRPRSISDDLCVDGARIVGASMVIEEVIGGAKMMSYA